MEAGLVSNICLFSASEVMDVCSVRDVRGIWGGRFELEIVLDDVAF